MVDKMTYVIDLYVWNVIIIWAVNVVEIDTKQARTYFKHLFCMFSWKLESKKWQIFTLHIYLFSSLLLILKNVSLFFLTFFLQHLSNINIGLQLFLCRQTDVILSPQTLILTQTITLTLTLALPLGPHVNEKARLHSWDLTIEIANWYGCHS